MSFKVVQLFDPPGFSGPDYGEMIRQSGIDAEFSKSHCTTEEQIIAAAHDADAVIAATSNKNIHNFSREVIDGLAQCRFIMSMGIGYNALDVDAATEKGIIAANVPDYCIDEMSDHTMALILACTRKISTLDRVVRAGSWKQEPDPEIQSSIWPAMTRLRDQTLGLLGLGRIAQMLVSKAKAFGMRIIAYDPYIDPKTIDSLGVEKKELDQFFAESDILSLHAPLTSETRHMLGLEQFKKMKSSAYIVNTARGELIDQEALCTALQDGILAGAALDVMDPEPINPDNHLLELENVILTPHSAHASIPAFITLMNRPGEEIARVLKGEWPLGLINPGAKEKFRDRWG
ncbi:MAG: C-terminal binding protein [Chloroflexi bacterium]|jgi:D-3-phosphoglycerate dehydrogenase / 2-oxoglutarate reductase|nr:C-terminal binding protein [Chloroflexota bacterium]